MYRQADARVESCGAAVAPSESRLVDSCVCANLVVMHDRLCSAISRLLIGYFIGAEKPCFGSVLRGLGDIGTM